MKAILFDMDGVLVDVSSSYRLAIKRTVESFMSSEISLSEIQAFKNRGGLNNDWDLTDFILRENGVNIERKKIIDTFQAIYLGDDFNGLIANEKWLAKRRMLEALHNKYALGIVTGRPRLEARYVLRRFDVARYFAVMITMADVPPDKGKPDPYGLLRATEKLSTTSGWYLGDTIDDMAAAAAAKLTPVGVLCASDTDDRESQRKLLCAHGAQHILSDVNEIAEVVK